jgi:predicted nucleotidyltransferase
MNVMEERFLMTTQLSDIKENILATLAYFDLFDYPLTGAEVFLFLGKKYRQPDFDAALNGLLLGGAIYGFDKYYTLKNDHYLVVRRLEGNRQAAKLIKVAEKVGALLIRFPYVRGIAISGSLSKNFADDDSDIDLFIITAKNRLWIARTLMHAFKKLTFLFNRQDYFCMNYYIDEQQLEIVEKTIYTAIEVVTLIPLQGDALFERFYAANVWTRHHLPNKVMRLSSAKQVKTYALKAFTELLFNNRFGNAIDNLLMKITTSRWQKKTQANKRDAKGIILAMDTGKHYSKPDPKNFHDKLLTRYANRLAALLNKAQGSLMQ